MRTRLPYAAAIAAASLLGFLALPSLAESDAPPGGATAAKSTGPAPLRIAARSPAPASRYRAPLALTAEVDGDFGPVAGTVAFHYAGQAIAGCEAVAVLGGKAACTARALPAGIGAIEARFSGDATYQASAGDALRHYVKAGSGSRFRDPDGVGAASLFLETPGGGLLGMRVNSMIDRGGRLLLDPGSGWSLAHTGDFNGDGRADLVVEHESGAAQVWFMDGLRAAVKTPVVADSEGARVAMVGDFDGDGRDDFLVKRADGSYAVWLMGEAGIGARHELLQPFSGLVPVAVADFDGDGHDDLVLRMDDRTLRVQRMRGGRAANSIDVALPGAGYAISHTPDLNGDGKADILLRGPDGQVEAWLMDGTNVTRREQVEGASAWRVTDVADFDRDGVDDLFAVGPSGEVALWLMDGARRLAAFPLRQASAWKLWQVADYDSDGYPDLLLVNDSGEVAAWILAAEGLVEWKLVEGVSDWRVIP